MTSQNGPYQSFNFTVNGVSKNLIIPCTSLPVATTIPTSPGIGASVFSGTMRSNQPQVVYVSVPNQQPAISTITVLPKPVNLTVAASSALETKIVAPNSSPKLASLLSTVRFASGSSPVNKTVVWRPKAASVLEIKDSDPAAEGAISTQSATVLRPVNATDVSASGDRRFPIVRAIRPRPNPSDAASGVNNIPILRATRVIRPIPTTVVRSAVPMVGSPTVKYVIQPVTRPAVSTSGVISPQTVIVSSAGVPLQGISPPKKTVTIKMPLNAGDGNSPTPQKQVVKLQQGFTIIELKDTESNVVKYIQVRKKESGRVQACSEALVPTIPAETTSEAMPSEDIKVIEIIPDDDEATPKSLESEMGDKDVSGTQEQEPRTSTPSPPPLELLPGQDVGQISPISSPGARRGIFETLNSMSLEDASAAVTALTLPPPSEISDTNLDIVLRGDDHVVVKNPGYNEEEEDDDDDDTVSADEASLGPPDLQIAEPFTLQPSIELEQTTCLSAKKKKDIAGGIRGKNVARRTGGRPLVALHNTAKRTGGRPMTPKQRYGIDVKECYVSLEKLYNTKPYVKWVDRHLFHILCCKDGKPGVHVKRQLRKRIGKDVDFDPNIKTPQVSGPTGKRAAAKKSRSNVVETPVVPKESADEKGQQGESLQSPSVGDEGPSVGPEDQAEHGNEQLTKRTSPRVPPVAEPINENDELVVYTRSGRRSRKRISVPITLDQDKDDEIEETVTKTSTKRRKKSESKQTTITTTTTAATTTATTTTSESVLATPLTTSASVKAGAASKKIIQIVKNQQSNVRPTSVLSTVRNPTGVSTTSLPMLRMATPASGNSGVRIVKSSSVVARSPGQPVKSPTSSEMKYYLVKTEKGSFLIPVPKSSGDQASTVAANIASSLSSSASSSLSAAVATTTTAASNRKVSSLLSPVPKVPHTPDPKVPHTPDPKVPQSPDKAPQAVEDSGTASENVSDGTSGSVAEPEADTGYEPAAAGMRQEDRISLLKEKLRLQQKRLEEMRKKKGDD